MLRTVAGPGTAYPSSGVVPVAVHSRRMAGGDPTAAPVWQFVAGRFAGFLDDLVPDAVSRAAVAAVRADVAALLTRWLRVQAVADGWRPKVLCSLATVEAIGGHANATALAGALTLDLLLVFPEETRPAATGRPATTSMPYALHRLTALLGERYGAVATDAQGWIGIRTTSRSAAATTPVDVRLLPAYRCAGGGVLVARTTRAAPGTPWQHLQPEAHRRILDRADHLTQGKARHLVRLVKAWRRSVEAPLSGFAIEILACEFLAAWLYRRRSLLFYDWMIRDFFFWLAAQAGRALPVPGTLEELPLGDRWLPAAHRAHLTARAAADLERDNEEVAALGRWREIFGLEFCSRGHALAGAVIGEARARRNA